MSGRHWYQERGGTWPFAACGKNIMDKSPWTVDMGAVNCPACKAAVQAAIESLRVCRAPRGALEAISSDP